jgi:stage V sporulation protein B
LNGAGMPKKAVLIVLTTLAAVVGCVSLFVYRAGPNDSALTAAAAGSAAGMLVGMILSGVVVYRQFGAFIPAASAVRIVVAAAVSLFVGRQMPNIGKIATLAECAAVFILYLTVLVVIREFKKQDLEQLKRILSKRK